MKKTFRIILSLVFAISLVASLAVLFGTGTSAAVVQLRDNKEAQVIEATEAGSTLTLNWNAGYITVPGKNGQLPFYLNENTSCFYTDVLLIKNAGTEITFSDGGVYLTNGGYVISSWTKGSDGYWVGDPDSANYYGMDTYTSPVQKPNANGGMGYKYVTSKDNETIRLGFRAGNGETECPKVTFKLTGEKGTFTKELEEENTAASFNADGTVSGIYWTCGYIGSSTNPNGYPGSINPSSANFAYSSIVKVAKAGTVITFTDASGTAYAANNAYVISLWKKDGTNRYYIDNTKTHYAGNNGADNVIKKGDSVVFTEKKNDDGSVTYTYTTTSDNEQIRFCYRNDTNHNSLPGVLPVITYVAPASDPEATTPAETTTATPAETTTATVGDNTTAPADDTTLPENTTVEAPVDETTATVEETTATVTSAENKKEKGCGGFAVATQIIALFGTALTAVVLKKKA